MQGCICVAHNGTGSQAGTQTLTHHSLRRLKRVLLPLTTCVCVSFWLSFALPVWLNLELPTAFTLLAFPLSLSLIFTQVDGTLPPFRQPLPKPCYFHLQRCCPVLTAKQPTATSSSSTTTTTLQLPVLRALTSAPAFQPSLSLDLLLLVENATPSTKPTILVPPFPFSLFPLHSCCQTSFDRSKIGAAFLIRPQNCRIHPTPL